MHTTGFCRCLDVLQLLLSLVTNVLKLAHRIIHTGDLCFHGLGYSWGCHLSEPHGSHQHLHSLNVTNDTMYSLSNPALLLL